MRRSRRARRGASRWLCAAAALAVALAATGCSRTLIERAIRARGGPLESLHREVDARVYQGFPGDWSWETTLLAPDLLRWTIHTYGEDQTYVYDGRHVTLYLGSASLPAEPAAAASFRTQARWFAVSGLDILADPERVTCAEIAPAELPVGVARGLSARFHDDGASYRLFFDSADRLIALEGDVSLPPVGAGRLRAEYGDFRPVDGFTLPFASRYVLAGQPLADETVRRAVPNDPTLTPATLAP